MLNKHIQISKKTKTYISLYNYVNVCKMDVHYLSYESL